MRIEISVVLCTYNRARLLPAALDALLAQTGSAPYEVILVDNNSTDETAAIGRRYGQAHPHRVRYVFEAQQGLSHARNAGILAATGTIVAFTDDDVEVANDWIESLTSAFAAHPTAVYVGGRILPRWSAPPPPWLTTAHWSPLALQDYGEQTFRSGPSWPVCLVGANLAFRRPIFESIGMFAPSFGRVRDGIGSTEDHELQLRLWAVGLEGVYVPSVVAKAEIPSNRMTKAYHIRWHKGHGRHCARMRLREIVPQEWAPMGRPADLVTLFAVPTFVYGELLKTMARWFEAIVRRRDPFFYGNRMRHLGGYIVESWRQDRAERSRPWAVELMQTIAAYARKVLGRLRGRRVSARRV